LRDGFLGVGEEEVQGATKESCSLIVGKRFRRERRSCIVPKGGGFKPSFTSVVGKGLDTGRVKGRGAGRRRKGVAFGFWRKRGWKGIFQFGLGKGDLGVFFVGHIKGDGSMVGNLIY